jgi:hypothetical protein
MQDKNANSTDSIESNDEMAALEEEIHDALAHGSHIQETVHRLTLKAMNARNLDLDSLQRIITAVIHGVRDGAQQTLQHTADQTHTAESQITEAIAGLDSALAGFAEASKLAVEEATGRARKFSDQELARTRADMESLESLFLDTLNNTASATKGLVSDIFHDLAGHAQRNGTAVGQQLKETIAIFAQQMKSVGHTQLETGAYLAHSTADFIHQLADGVLSGIKDRKKSDD